MSIEDMVVAGWSEKPADCRLVFEGNARPMWVFSARGIVDVNRAALQHYAFSRAEFLSMSIADFEPSESSSEGRLIGQHQKKDGSLIDVELSSFAITFGGMPATLRSVADVTDLRHPECALRALLATVVTAQEGERRRIALELDDETAQTLVSVLIGLRTVEEAQDLPGARQAVGGLCASVATVLHGIERIASGLRPSMLDRLGLEPALERLATEASRDGGFAVALQVAAAPVLRLPESMEISLYRIVQEALTNAAKHAAAKTVSVLMRRNDETVRLVIDDDGNGFDIAALSSRTHLGLMLMRERAYLIGGSMTVRSSVGHGTTLCVHAPLPAAATASRPVLS